MSENLTRQQLQTFLNSLLRANSSTTSWVNFCNPNTRINRGLLNPLFDSIDNEWKIELKHILQQHGGVVFGQYANMTFPVNFTDRIPRIVAIFVMRRFPQPTEAVAEMHPRPPVCGGGAAAVEASSPADDGFPSWLDRSRWGVPVSKSQQKGSGCARSGCAVSESSDATRKRCPWGEKCRLNGTWGGCPNIHPDDNQKTRKLPERGGPTIVVCKSGISCKYGNKCWLPHPTNPSCVVEQKQISSGPIHIVRVCTLKKCDGTNCQCAHLPQDVIEEALERKRKAFSKSSSGGVACSVVAGAAVNSDHELQAANLEVASLTGALSDLSLEKPHCGGGAHACSLPTESRHVVEGDLLGLLEPINFHDSNERARQPPLSSAPPMILSSFGSWDEIFDFKTGISYFQNNTSGEIRLDRPVFFCEKALVSHNPSASCAVACQLVHSRPAKRQVDAVQPSASCAVVQRHKVKQEDTSVAPKATKRPAGSDSGPESSKKGRQ